MDDTAATQPSPASPIPQPIVLTITEKPAESPNYKPKHSFFATLGILFSGWLLGNLILLAIVGTIAISVTSATGMVKVPLLTEYFFGKSPASAKVVDSYALNNAEEKLKKIDQLQKGEVLPTLVFYEDEVNALLASKIETDANFPISWNSLSLHDGKFVFTGAFKQTNAPIVITAQLKTQGLTGEIEIVSAKFGKISMPSFLTTNIVENELSRVGLSLTGNQIPSKAVRLSEGVVTLEDVSNPNQ